MFGVFQYIGFQSQFSVKVFNDQPVGIDLVLQVLPHGGINVGRQYADVLLIGKNEGIVCRCHIAQKQ